jgi:predicted HicB family RNase H-like nuclease
MIIKYNGYSARVELDEDRGVMFGRILELSDLVSFEGRTVEELRAALAEAVDDYLAWCTESGTEPEKPYSGRVLLRLEPETHKAAALAAERRGQSLNALLVVAVKTFLGEEPSARHLEPGHVRQRGSTPFQDWNLLLTKWLDTGTSTKSTLIFKSVAAREADGMRWIGEAGQVDVFEVADHVN